jgi:chromosome segregation ATPase
MNQEIKFSCSHCEQKMVVDAAAVGLMVACPGCGTELMVPALDAPEASVSSAVRPRSQAFPEQRGPLQSVASTETLGVPDSRQELIAATVQNSRLEGQIAELRQQIKRLKADVSRVTAERDEAIGQVQQMAPELDVARENLEAYTQAVDTLQQQVRQAEADVEEARQQLTEVQAERTLGLRDNQSLQQHIEAQEEALTSLQADFIAASTKGQELESELAKVRENLAVAEQAGEFLRAEVGDLTKERDSLRRSVSESGLGQELVAIREQLAVSEKECKRLSLHSRQLNSDIEAAEKARKERDDLIRTLKTELDNARRSAEAASDAKQRNDNEVLRGIISRQNSELEQKHAQLTRLKRARLGVQFAYAAFALALAGIIFWAVKTIPKMKPGGLLDF